MAEENNIKGVMPPGDLALSRSLSSAPPEQVFIAAPINSPWIPADVATAPAPVVQQTQAPATSFNPIPTPPPPED